MARNYGKLRPEKIIATICKLEMRIRDALGARGLLQVCTELQEIAVDAKKHTIELRKPVWLLYLILLLTIAFIVAIGWLVHESYNSLLSQHLEEFSSALKHVLQDLALSVALTLPIPFLWAGIAFTLSIESRWKRYRALRYLHEVRSIIHVIDMHQLTKDPRQLEARESPDHLTGERLILYLDFCSELLSLCGKIAALYAETSHDAIVIETVSDLGQITAELSNKIWQKIIIVEIKMQSLATEALAASGDGHVSVPRPIAHAAITP
jgi:hypothetical protein